MLEARVLVHTGVESVVLVGIWNVHRLPGGGHVSGDADVDGEPRLVGAGARCGLLLAQIVRLEVKDPREAALVRLVDEQDLDALALDETLHVGEDAEDHVLDGALLLEDHPGQVEEHLVPLYFQLRFLVQLGIPQPDAAELQVRGKDLPGITQSRKD